MHVGTRQGNCIFPFLCLHQPIGCERKTMTLRRHKNARNTKSFAGSKLNIRAVNSGTPTKRQVSKRQVSKCLVSKRPVSKRQVYKTSGLQNVRFQNVWFENVQF